MELNSTIIRVLDRDDGKWVNADDMIKHFQGSIKVYREHGFEYFAKAVEAELADFKATLSGDPILFVERESREVERELARIRGELARERFRAAREKLDSWGEVD